MNRESRQARRAREARRAALPPPPVDPFRNVPKRPWPPRRILYTILLWLLWSGILGVFSLMSWYGGDRSFSVLLVPAPRMVGINLLNWAGIALLVAIPLRLLIDNPRMSAFPILLGAWAASMFSYQSSENMHGLDRNVIQHHVYKRQVVVRNIERRQSIWGAKGPGSRMSDVDNPGHAGQLITFPTDVMSGSVGDIFCVDVIVGQFGGLWALPPERCAQPQQEPL